MDAPEGHFRGEDLRGYAYDLVAPDGSVLASREGSDVVVEGPGGTQTKEEMCKGKRERFSIRAAPLSGSVVEAIGTITPLPDEISFGAVSSGTMVIPYCDVFHDVATEVSAIYGLSVYDDCMGNPGRYDPDYPPDPAVRAHDLRVLSLSHRGPAAEPLAP